MSYSRIDDAPPSEFNYDEISQSLKLYDKLTKNYPKSSGVNRQEILSEISKVQNSLKDSFKKPRITKDAKARMNKLEEYFVSISSNFAKVKGNDEELRESVSSEERLEDFGIQERESLAYKDSVQLRKDELIERGEKIQNLNKDFIQVNELFKDAAKMIHEDGQQLNVIEAHVGNAASETGKGVQELHKADGYQKKATKKMCCIFIIAAVVVAVLLAIVLGVVVF